MTTSVKTDVVVPCRADRAYLRLETELGPRITRRRDYGRTSIAELHSRFDRLRDHFFPSFDAELAVTAIDDTSCLLTVASTYEPPFGRFGEVLDRTVMHGLGAATAADFAHRLGSLIAHDAKKG